MFDPNPHGGWIDDPTCAEFDAKTFASARSEADTSLAICRHHALEMTVVAKRQPSFSRDDVDHVRTVLRGLRQGPRPHSKFLIFDLGRSEGAAVAPDGFPDMLAEISAIIVDVPVLTVAWARGRIAGADLELAFACSLIAGEATARFCFDLDLVSSLQTYSVLAHKIGFVRAERIMESGAELDIQQMNDLMLATVVRPSDGLAGIADFARARARRHNASCGIYRAQRLAMPMV